MHYQMIIDYYISQKKPAIKNKGNISIYSYYKVPTITELNNYLYKFHAENFINYKDIQKLIKDNKIGFYDLDILIIEYINICPVCVRSAKTLHREEPVKSINIEGWNIRYEFYITYLNDNLSKAFKVKYILGIIDAFSLKGMIYKLNNKTSDEVLKYIIEYCLNNSFPREFVSDNGPEFKNSKIEGLCQKEGIDFIHGVL